MPVRDLLSAASTQGGGPADPYFNYVPLLLNGDGTNGAQNNTFLDSSTNNFTITRNGNTTQDSFSPYGSLWSNYFGSGNYLATPSNSNLTFGTGDFCVELWYYQSSNAFAGLYSNSVNSGGGDAQFELQISASTYYPTLYGWNTAFLTSNTASTPNQWNHIVVCRSGINASMFLNGNRVANATVSNDFSSTNAFNIGRQASGSNYFSGYISNVRAVKGFSVYNPASTTITVPTAPLTAISGTSLLTCQSNRFIDNSSNAFAITVSGSPSVQRFSPFNPTAPYSTSVIGGSGYFNGSGDYLTTSTASSGWAFGAGDFTVELWINPSAATNRTILANRAGTIGLTSHWSLEFFNTAQRVEWHTGLAIVASSNTNAPLNAWTHIAVVRSGTTLKIYQNGVQVATATDLNVYTDVNPLQIGYEPVFPSGNAAFAGYMSNIRIVKGTAVYTAAFTPPTAPVTAISGTQFLGNMTNAGIPDLAMQNNLQTVGSAQVSTSVKKYGTGSISFNGSTDYLTAPTLPTQKMGGAFTWEGWVYLNALPSTNAWSMLIQQGAHNGGTNFLELGIQNNSGTYQLNMNLYNSGYLFQPTINISPSIGTWYHIAGYWNGTTAYVAFNGTVSSGASYSGSAFPSGFPLVLGRYIDSANTYYLNGYLDDVRITNGYCRYGSSNFTPPTAALPTY
jgi:hypothetical protein